MINFPLISTLAKGIATDSIINNKEKTIEIVTNGFLANKGKIIIKVTNDEVIFEVYENDELYDKGIFRKNIPERVFSWLDEYYS